MALGTLVNELEETQIPETEDVVEDEGEGDDINDPNPSGNPDEE